MDKETGEVKGIIENSDKVNIGRSEGLSGNWSDSDNGIVLNSGVTESARGELADLNANFCVVEPSKSKAVFESLVVTNSGETRNVTGENGDLAVKIDDFGLIGRQENQEIGFGQENGETSDEVEQDNSRHLSNSVGGVVHETVIVITPEYTAGIGEGNLGLEIKSNELGPSKVLVDKPKTKVVKGEKQKQSCVIEMKCGMGGGGNGKEILDGERVCRICHLSSEGSLETTAATTASTTASIELIQLGCGCKDELGIAHAHCAEAWFKLKGNRMCEICGEMAKNVTGVGDFRFMEEWNERRFIGQNGSLSERDGGCWRGQPFCNFLMACLVIAFVLPWFFRMNMF